MQNKSIAEAIQTQINAATVHLPVHPAISRGFLKNPASLTDARQIKSLVAQDPALVCHLFRAANSSFFMGLKQTQTLEDAITRLGYEKAWEVLEQVCRHSLALSQGRLFSRYLTLLWQHSVGCAAGCRWLAERCGYQGLAQQAYLAGLLHDIGKLFLLASLEEISTSDDFNMPFSDHIIHEVIETMHVEQGLRLAGDWNLPDLFFTVINRHHDTSIDSHNIVLALVKLANKGCCKVGLGLQQDKTLVLPTTAEAQFLGISEIALAEYEIMLEDRFFDEGQGESAT